MTTFTAGDVLTATNANSFSQGYMGGNRYNGNLSIPSGGATLTTNITCDPNRLYTMSVTAVVYYTTANGYLLIGADIDGTRWAEGYMGVTTSDTYRTSTIWTRPVSGLSGSITFSGFFNEVPGNMYVAGNSSYDMTSIKIYDVGAA